MRSRNTSASASAALRPGKHDCTTGGSRGGDECETHRGRGPLKHGPGSSGQEITSSHNVGVLNRGRCVLRQKLHCRLAAYQEFKSLLWLRGTRASGWLEPSRLSNQRHVARVGANRKLTSSNWARSGVAWTGVARSVAACRRRGRRSPCCLRGSAPFPTTAKAFRASGNLSGKKKYTSGQCPKKV